jgi:integrase
VTLNRAFIRGDIKQLPQFATESTGHSEDTPRIWFNEKEYATLKKAIDAHIANTKTEAAKELKDYVLIGANTGMRVGEAMSVRFCDVTIVPDGNDECLEIRNIKGKRGRHGQCKSFTHAVAPFKRCIARHLLTLANYKASQENVFKEYHRDMFREILKKANLYMTKDRTPKKRDLMSLRHTYICLRLLRGVPIYDIAANCRTSAQTIQRHYAKHLSILGSETINKRSW